jgi:protein TonB
MALKKNPKYDLKAKYTRVLEICMIGSLAFLVAAFKFFPAIESGGEIVKESQELVNVEDVIITKRDVLPPPPPKPPIPIEAPTDEVMEDMEIELTDLVENAEVTGPPPPPVKETEEVEPVFFVAVEQMPEPIGGIAAILAKIEYPPLAKRAGVQGRVLVKAFVDESGAVQNVELIKGIGAGCDEEALKAVSNTPFNPGKQRGKPVKVQVTVPVKFVLK